MSIDLISYQGRWYELARTDVAFERDCEDATADYILQYNQLWIINTCYRGGHPVRQSIGIGTPTLSPSTLRLQFIYMMSFGKKVGAGAIKTPETLYNILWTDYTNFALVKSTDNFWVLSRKTIITEKEYYFVRGKIFELGYNPNQLQWN